MTDETRKSLTGSRLNSLLGGSKPEKPAARCPVDDDLAIPDFLRRTAPRTTYSGPLHDDLSDFGRTPVRRVDYGFSSTSRSTAATNAPTSFESSMRRIPTKLVGDERVIDAGDLRSLGEALWGVLMDAMSDQRLVLREKAILKNKEIFHGLLRQMLEGGWHDGYGRNRPLLALPKRGWKVTMKQAIEAEPEGAAITEAAREAGQVEMFDETTKPEPEAPAKTYRLHYECDNCGFTWAADKTDPDAEDVCGHCGSDETVRVGEG